jgi:hypothetical protein
LPVAGEERLDIGRWPTQALNNSSPSVREAADALGVMARDLGSSGQPGGGAGPEVGRSWEVSGVRRCSGRHRPSLCMSALGINAGCRPGATSRWRPFGGAVTGIRGWRHGCRVHAAGREGAYRRSDRHGACGGTTSRRCRRARSGPPPARRAAAHRQPLLQPADPRAARAHRAQQRPARPLARPRPRHRLPAAHQRNHRRRTRPDLTRRGIR